MACNGKFIYFENWISGRHKNQQFYQTYFYLSRLTKGQSLGILGPATTNTPIFAYDQWDFKEQPQGHNLHILDFLNGNIGAGHTKHTSFGI